MIFNKDKKSSGFTLIEVLVAIAILLIAVVGPMSLVGGSLSQISTARDQVIAVNLAQEGIEVVRQKRDSNMLAKWNVGTGAWSDGLNAGNYIVDAPTLTITSSASQPIYQDTTGWYHQYSSTPTSGTQTKFSRVVNITDISTTEKKITSTVTWSTSDGSAKTISVSESIFGINL